MDWVENMNNVITYIENNLDGEISFKEIGRLSACPAGLFQRVFAAITNVSLSEYIRRRRLSAAALELLSSDIKVIDVAVKYGYESADAFSVAFKRMHGITPSNARQGVLKSYPRLSFSLSIKGAVEMNYRIVEKEAFKAVGKVITVSEGNPVPQFWQDCKDDGTGEILLEIANGKPMLGICFEMEANNVFKYMIGAETDLTHIGMEQVSVPKSTWLVFECIGPMPTAIQDVWKRIFSEFLPQSSYKHAGTPDLEVYYAGDNSKDDYRCEIWIPVVKN